MKFKERLFVLICLCSTVFVSWNVWIWSLGDHYYDECFMTQQDIKIMNRTLQLVQTFYEDTNQKFWLDFGTLLGAWHDGTVIPYDYDGDISRLVETNDEEEEFFIWRLKQFMEANGCVMPVTKYVHCEGGPHVDLFRWKMGEDDYIYSFNPPYTPIVKYFRKVHRDLIFPTQQIVFFGRPTMVPRDMERVLESRFRNYRQKVPYKKKCYAQQ